jgi:hypothetical protein
MNIVKTILHTNLDGYNKRLPNIQSENLQVGDEVFLEEKYHDKLREMDLPICLTICARRVKPYKKKTPRGNDVLDSGYVIYYQLELSERQYQMYCRSNDKGYPSNVYERCSHLF